MWTEILHDDFLFVQSNEFFEIRIEAEFVESMESYSVSGRLNGKLVHVSWHDGDIWAYAKTVSFEILAEALDIDEMMEEIAEEAEGKQTH